MNRNTTSAVFSLIVLSSLFLLSSSLFPQGSLTPPGAPAPTMKTLDQVEPRIAINATNTPGDADSLFKITQPGSYYLTGNITGVAGKHGIEIVASGVTLDLNGFDLAGIPAMGAFDGVSGTVAGLTNIAVVNGSVRNWGDRGVDLLGGIGSVNCRVDRVLASGNAGSGILSGSGTTVTNCSATNNSGNGIHASSNSTVTDCLASNNGGDGIFAGDSCTVTNCTANFNVGNGITSFPGCTLTNCTANFNTGIGISASTGCTITNSTVRANTLDGIKCFSSCVIRGNTCASNGSGGDGAGIHVTSGDNRIEGNNCTGADRGIEVNSAGNIIIRNTCRNNPTNWSLVAGNVILVVNATVAGAVTGNSGGTAPGSTDPSANFTY